MPGGIRLFRFSGIDVYLDWSLLIIFLLVTFTLGLHLFPIWHPDLSLVFTMSMGLVAAVLFFLSVLTHEFSHALVGRAQGVTVRRITLFIFGGMAHMESEAPNWKAEFWMTIVGPLTSLMLGIGFLLLSGLIADPGIADTADPDEAITALSPAATLLFWLGGINLLLAIFNLVPGFPLDGGRVLRALLWGITGSYYKATRWASRGGQAFAGLLIGVGIAMMLGVQVPPFGAGLLPGIWFAFIGWFLNNAALASYKQSRMRKALEGVPVSRIAQREVVRVPASISIQQLVDDFVLGAGDQRAWPVERDGQLVGLVTLHDVRATDKKGRSNTAVTEVMTPWQQLQTVSPEEDAGKALEKLGYKGVSQLPVVKNGDMVGMLRREDLMRWISWSDNGGEYERPSA